MIENTDHKDLDFETQVLIYRGIGVFITFLLLLCLISAFFWKYENRTSLEEVTCWTLVHQFWLVLLHQYMSLPTCMHHSFLCSNQTIIGCPKRVYFEMKNDFVKLGSWLDSQPKLTNRFSVLTYFVVTMLAAVLLCSVTTKYILELLVITYQQTEEDTQDAVFLNRMIYNAS